MLGNWNPRCSFFLSCSNMPLDLCMFRVNFLIQSSYSAPQCFKCFSEFLFHYHKYIPVFYISFHVREIDLPINDHPLSNITCASTDADI